MTTSLPGKEAMTDVKLVQTPDLIFDFPIADDGDFELVDSFDTSLQMSIFCERRASSSEVSEAIRRRGWIGNVFTDFPGFEIGSKIWLFEQARMTNDTFNGINNAAVDSLQWLIEDGFAIDIASSIEGMTRTGRVDLKVTIFASSSLVEERFFSLWVNTGV